MEKNMYPKSLPGMKTGKSVLGFNIHGDGYQTAYNGNVCYNCRGFSWGGIVHYNIL